MRLTVLGSSGSYPAPGRPGSGYLIEHEQTRVWCDAGPGTFGALGDALDPDLVDAVVASHQHADHCADILALFHSLAFRRDPRRGLPLYAPQAVIDRLLAFLDAGPDDVIHTTFDFRPVGDGDRATIGDFVVTFAASDHSVPTVASRWEAGSRVLAYSADTGPEGSWPEVARDADLFLCEASYQDAVFNPDFPFHLRASEAGRTAREVGASRLMLTHLPPHLDPTVSVAEAERSFDRPVAVAVPGGRFRV